jgi:hypothetical protein
MTLPRILKTKRLKFLSALALASSLASCSGGDGGLAGESGVSLGTLGLSWTVPTEREDTTPLLISEIAGYRVYYGSVAGDYQNQVDVDSSLNVAQVPALPSGTYYVVVTAIDTEGRESLYSPEVVINL